MEAAFNAASIRVYLPETSSIPDQLYDTSKTQDEINRDWETVFSAKERNVAFFDETLIYYLVMFIPNDAIRWAGEDISQGVSQLVKRIQRTMTVSFLPPNQTRPPQAHSRPITDPTLLHLGTNNMPLTPNTPGGGGMEPSTPNPFPSMRGGEEQYADVDGVTVWEGDVGPVGQMGNDAYDKVSARSVIRKIQGGHEVIWEGEVPIAYVRTQIQNPLLALTASITLRPNALAIRGHKTSSSVATVDTMHSDEEDEAERDGSEDDEAGMSTIDLLGGLAGSSDFVPATRLGPSARQDLSLKTAKTSSSTPSSAITPVTAPHHSVPPTATSGPTRSTGELPSHLLPVGSTMRKSFRRVLDLSPGLRVRMRNLVLPQLLPPSSDGQDEEGDEDGEKKVVLCVEVENAPDGTTPPIAFMVSRVEVEIGGKGGKATAALTCQPTPDSVFPLKLYAMEQYNLLYGVSVASPTEEANYEVDQTAKAVLRNLGTGEVNRPVSIVVVGRPYYLDESGNEVYPTKEFNSRWNCNLDLSSYYASLPTALAPLALSSQATRQRTSKTPSIPPNAIVGDKRYSLATLLAGDKEDGSPQAGPSVMRSNIANQPKQRIVSGRPLMPSQLVNQVQTSNRSSSVRQIPNQSGSDDKSGLMVSVRLLDGAGEGKGRKTINVLEEFSIEVYINNRTEELRRFKLSIPGPGRDDGRVRDSIMNKKKDGSVRLLDDPVLRYTLQQHLSSSPGVTPMENDIRCGPLLPGASMSARIRFMALRDGVHQIERLRVTGVGDDLDFIISPVLDIVVGSGDD